MEGLLTRKTLALATAAALLAACSGAGNGVPSGSATTALTATRVSSDAQALKLSGQFDGSVKDSVHGSGKGKLMLSQSKSALGGALTIAGNPTEAYVSWTAVGDTVDGTSVFVASSGDCVFSHAGKYDSKTLTLTGSYKSTYGCAGETGTYTLKQKCYFKGDAADVRPAIGPHPC